MIPLSFLFLTYLLNFTSALNTTNPITTTTITNLNYKNITITTKSLPLKPPREPQHLSLILQHLRDEQAQKCDYGPNPLIFDICSNVDAMNLHNYHLKSTRVEDLVTAIIRPDVIDKLQANCKPGEWCFNDESNSRIMQHPIGRTLMKKHANVLCLFAGCFKEIEGYVNNCVATEFSKNVLKVVPVLCEASGGNENLYCLEPTLQLFHVSAAVLGTRKNGGLINTCKSKLMNENECRNECRSIALETNKLEYCCPNTSLVKSYKPLNWITDYSNHVASSCDLPLTGLCWSDGKYYIGVSPNILMLAIVATVIGMSIFFVGIYICFSTTRKTKPNTNNVSYSQINNDVEEEMNLVRDESDTEFDLSYEEYQSKKKMDLISQQGLSRFVNHQEATTKNLMDY